MDSYEGDPSQETIAFSLYRGWRVQVLVMSLVFLLSAVFLIIITATRATGPGWGFTAFFSFAAAYVSYGLAWRTVFDLKLQGDELLWQTPLRSGSRSLRDICELQPWSWGRNAEVIKFADGGRLLVMTGRGFLAFSEAIADRLPGVPINAWRFTK